MASGSDAGDPMLGLGDLHVFTEALLTLALGRQIVVPQPYAFDSVSFLSLAAIVLTKRPQHVAGFSVDRPLGWHAHGAGLKGIDAALAEMIARDATSENPFHSSAWPLLNGMGAEERRDLSEHPLKGLRHVDPDRARQLKVVLREFRDIGPVEVLAGRDGRPLLAEIVRELRDAPPTASTGRAADARTAEVIDRLSRAARALVPRDRSLDQRSLLRSNAWPWDPDRRPPVEVVGSAADLDLFVEFVDTAYNRTIAESIGGIHGLFSTAVASDDDRQLARGIAQEMALHVRKRGAAGEGSPSGAPHGLAFEVADHGLVKESHAKALSDLRQRAVDALSAIMSARSEVRRDGSPTEFWASADALNRALAAGDARAVEKALTRHSRLLGSILGGESRQAGTVMQMVVNGGLPAVGASVGLVLGGGLIEIASSAVLGAVGTLAPQAPAAVRGLLNGRRVASAVRGSLRVVAADHG